MGKKFLPVLKRVMEKENKNLDAIIIVLNNGSLKPMVPNEIKLESIVGLDVNFEPIEIDLSEINDIQCYSQKMFDIWKKK